MSKKNGSYTVNGNEPPKASLAFSLRLNLGILAFFGFFLCYAQRNGLAVSLVCMANSTADGTDASNNSFLTSSNDIPASCQRHITEEVHLPSQILFWPKQTRGVILGSFYWGYALTQIAASFFATYLGPKRALASVVFISSAATFLIPIFAQIHSYLVVFLRVLAGAAQGGLWPIIFRFWATWAPETEKATLLSLQSSGLSMGTIISFFLGGIFCSFSFGNSIYNIFRFGWTYFFYMLGGLGIVWSIVWLIVASDSPSNNHWISKKEKEYIQRCKEKEQIEDSKTKIPWGPMLKSRAFWCFLVSMFFCDFGLYAIWAVVPEYMKEVLMFSVKENGLLSALPHAASLVVVLTTGKLADFIISKKYLNIVNARKLFHGLGTFVPAVCLLGISFLDCQHRSWVVLLLILGVAFNGLMVSGGYVVNVTDFSGVHSGLIFGIGNTISSIAGFFSPYITSWITANKKTSEWRVAFTLYAASFFISALVFCLFARGEPEPWAVAKVDDKKLKKIVDEEQELMKMTSEDPKNNPVA